MLNTDPRAYPLVAARDVGADLPRVGEVLAHPDIGELHATRRFVAIGIHGSFPSAIMHTLLGEPTGTRPTFAGMKSTVKAFLGETGVGLEAYGEGKEVEQGLRLLVSRLREDYSEKCWKVQTFANDNNEQVLERNIKYKVCE